LPNRVRLLFAVMAERHSLGRHPADRSEPRTRHHRFNGLARLRPM
jgi:hypothetical protein